jgi:hypothetical protein
MGQPAAPDVGMSIHVVIDADLAEQFDAYRRRQDRIPTVAEAARRLLARALDSDHSNHATA